MGAEKLDEIMKDSKNQFIKVRDKWYQNRAMILSADRLNILISSKGTDLKKTKVISVEEISEVTLGMTDSAFMKVKQKIKTAKGDEVTENMAFTIRFKDTVKIAPLHLIAEDTSIAGAWVEGLDRIREKVSGMTSAQRHTWWLWDKFKSADKDGNGQLEAKEVKKFFKSINLEMDDNNFRGLFAKYDKNQTNSLSWANIKEMYAELLIPKEFEELYLKIAGDDKQLQLHEFRDFLRDYQKETHHSDEQIKQMILDYEKTDPDSTTDIDQLKIGLYGFATYLRQSAQVIDPEKEKMFESMEKPLTDYWIASSHNTYLEDDQLKGPSSVEAYKKALQKGCRCVELDCWNGEDGQPIIYHGHTMTSKIKFYDVIVAINEYAFRTSPYPLILSLENHCNVDQQNKMAQIMKNVFKEKLLDAQIDSNETVHPSP